MPTQVTEVPLAEPIFFADTGDASGMVKLDGGVFQMGSEDPEHVLYDDGESPVRGVTVRPFYIDPHAVTNERFAAFVAATGYVTDAERFGWSFVFHLLLPKKYAQTLRRTNALPGLGWWIAVPGAYWRRPEGQQSSINKRMDHPVVQVSWNDAVAYCRWAGLRLPSEAEWEYASRGGRSQQTFPWGGQLTPRGQHRCNVWQGKFPEANTQDDGYLGTCPVDAFSPNDFGLYNTVGNVWEWCLDWFSAQHGECLDNPVGPDSGTHKAQRGGSFLCHRSYCNRYRNSARTGNTPDSATSNNGFRCVRDI